MAAAAAEGKLEELLLLIGMMGDGAEELFKPWIAQAVKTALTDHKQEPAAIYAALIKSATIGTISAGLEAIAKLIRRQHSRRSPN